MLFTAGKISRLGRVDDGNSAMDYDDEEISRKISINSSFHNYSWKKHDIYLIDTPGDDNFLNETLFATHVCDAAVFVTDAILGVKGQTIKFATMVAERNLPSMIVINKMDRERADFSRTLGEIRGALPVKPVVVQIPIGAEEHFRGIVDVVSGNAYQF
jgi:elongation factor G